MTVWIETSLTDEGDATRAIERSHAMLDRQATPQIENDVEWARAGLAPDVESLIVFTLGSPDDITGFAPVWTHRSSLGLSAAGKTFGSIGIERWVSVGGPMLDADALDERARSQAAAAFVETLRGRLGRRGVVFLQGLPEGDAAYELVNGRDERIRRHYHVLPHGPIYARRFIDLPRTYDAYLAKFSAKTRSTFKRKIKKLGEAAGSVAELRTYRDSDQIDAFLDAAIEVSKTTYQWNFLGIGLRDRARLERQCRFAAREGWLRCYVLWSGGAPIAFLYGLVARSTYYYIDVGFDPAWSKYSAGLVLNLLMIEDLITQPGAPKQLDFMYGDMWYKEHLSTRSRMERHFYLIPRTAWGTSVAITLRSIDGAVEGSAALLDRLGLKDKIRRLIRRNLAEGDGEA